MRKVIQAFWLFMCTVLITVQTAQAASPSAGSIFSSIGGTTTIDRGGAIHSQARSIYSLGGGMVSFQGKRVSLLAADPPSFSAGCNGISWHFGGFAFISLDEIRQLVEAVAQASLGIAVDLAMQTLCPQCYAVMAKLRDMSNLMRNAAADACSIAENFGNMLKKEGGIFSSAHRVSSCSQTTAESGETASVLDSWAGSACKLLGDAESKLDANGDKTLDFLQFGQTSDGTTPSKNQLALTGNITYEALTALGYEDGPMKDLWMSLLGMALVPPKPAPDCRTAFASFYGTAQSTLSTNSSTLTDAQKAALNSFVSSADQKLVQASSATDAPKPSDSQEQTATPTAGGTTKSANTCYAPPLLTGVASVGKYFLCGANVQQDMQTFANNYYSSGSGDALKKLQSTSLGAMCNDAVNPTAQNPMVYTCRQDSARCLQPKMIQLSALLPNTPPTGDVAQQSGYTGLAWMVGDALFDGARRIMNNTPGGLRKDTIAVLNGSGWPLYRLLNMAAVYPGMAGDLLNAYTAAIAAQYAMDTLDKIARVGQDPSINLSRPIDAPQSAVNQMREDIMKLAREGDGAKEEVLARLAEKRKLVEVILQVNKTLQAEVIGQGLAGNSKLAASLKSQVAVQQKPATP